MEFSYSSIRQMDVISLTDGKHLGRVSDLVFDFPENNVKGFYVTGCKGFRFTRQDVFLPISSIVRIGEDVILTDADAVPPSKEKPCRKQSSVCQPKDNCENELRRGCRPNGERRNYEEYE